MKKILLILLTSVILNSCSNAIYTKEFKTQITGINFSNGQWILGDIEVDATLKDYFTQMVLNDFTKHLNDRIRCSLNENSLLIATKIPLNPRKSDIIDLKKGTNCDFYINIKCEDARNNLENFNFIEHNYYKKQMSFGKVTLEVYDLNLGILVYSQRVYGSIDESMTFSPKKPTKILIIGCYKKIINEINKKYKI